MWKVTHKRKNGTNVNDEAVEIGVTLLILDCWIIEFGCFAWYFSYVLGNFEFYGLLGKIEY